MHFFNSSSGYSSPPNGCTNSNTIEITSKKDAINRLYDNFDLFISTYLVPATIVVGILGNIFFLFMIWRLHRMRTTYNIYLASLAITDTVFLLSNAPLFVYAMYSSPISLSFPFENKNSCYYVYASGFMCHFLSVSIITLVSFERFCAICQPFFHRQIQNKTRNHLTISAVAIAIIMSGLILLRRGKLNRFCLIWPKDDEFQTLPTVYRVCQPIADKLELIVFANILYTVYFLMAVASNGYMYVKIVMKLHERRLIYRRSKRSRHHHKRSRNHIAQALVITGLIFFTTQTPIRICDINESLVALEMAPFLSEKQMTLCSTIGYFFLYLNSAVNSYVFMLTSSYYRKGFKETLCTVIGRRRGSQKSSAWFQLSYSASSPAATRRHATNSPKIVRADGADTPTDSTPPSSKRYATDSPQASKKGTPPPILRFATNSPLVPKKETTTPQSGRRYASSQIPKKITPPPMRLYAVNSVPVLKK